MENTELEQKINQFIYDIKDKTVDELKALHKFFMDYDDYASDDENDPKFMLDLCKIGILSQAIISKENEQY